MRDICCVIENMIDEVQTLLESYTSEGQNISNYNIICFSKEYIKTLQEIHQRAKITAPEAMLWRWHDLDSAVSIFLRRSKEYGFKENSFILKYLEKWE